MEREQIKELLKEHLTIDIKERNDMYQRDVIVTISFDGEEICSDTYNIERK